VPAEQVFPSAAAEETQGGRVAVDDRVAVEQEHGIGSRFKECAVPDFRLLQLGCSFLDPLGKCRVGLLQGGIGAPPAPAKAQGHGQTEQAGQKQDAGSKQRGVPNLWRDVFLHMRGTAKEEQAPAGFERRVKGQPSFPAAVGAVNDFNAGYVCRARYFNVTGAGDVFRRRYQPAAKARMRNQRFARWCRKPRRLAVGDSFALAIDQHGVIEGRDSRLTQQVGKMGQMQDATQMQDDLAACIKNRQIDGYGWNTISPDETVRNGEFAGALCSLEIRTVGEVVFFQRALNGKRVRDVMIALGSQHEQDGKAPPGA
jgi:hypothetical protein